MEATRVIRKSTAHQPAILALTANAFIGDKKDCLNAGMDDYMTKPIKMETLIEQLQRWSPANRLVKPRS